MTQERRGQIALLVLKEKMRREGVKVSSSMRREIGNGAKCIGIPMEEASEFAKIMILELVDEALVKSNKQE